MLKTNEIYNMDCMEGLKLLDDNSIDLVVIDPPYLLNLNETKNTTSCNRYANDLQKLKDGFDLKEEIKVLADFYYYSSQRVYQDGYISVRTLIDDFTERINYNEREKIENTYNVLKKNIINTGFIDKYIQSDNETFVTIKNNKEFDTLLEIRIKKLQLQHEIEDEEEL